MRSQFFGILFFFPLVLSALEVKDVKTINIISEAPNGVKTGKIIVEKMKSDRSFTQADPHLFMNPEKTVAKWSGFELRKALKGYLTKGNRPLVVSGADGYSAEFSEQLVSNFPIIIALEKDGATLTPKQGGPQIAMPLDDSKIPAQYKNEAFWVWYLSAIFIGQPAPLLSVQDDSGTRELDLTKMKNVKTVKRVPCFPAGKRTTVEPRQAVELSYVPLTELVKLGPNQKVTVSTYLGTETQINTDVGQFLVAFATNGSRIPPLFGGPIELIHEKKPNQCLYFINKVSVSP